jgi:broad specificity phosphatase PhoE
VQSAVRQVLLVRHASTAASARRAFPADEPIDGIAQDACARLARELSPSDAHLLCSPSLRCRQTARALGLQPAIEPRLSECDFGSWVGLTLAEVDPAGAAAWISDPDAAPHGGESVTAFAARVGSWLAEQAAIPDGEPSVAITHAGVIRAAVVHALAAPLRAVWQLDPAPLSITELRVSDGRWTVSRVGARA